MRPEVEQELAHTLLVELLAYQFTLPVRWIETQDVVLSDKMTERIIEIGPTDTLGVMLKRTHSLKYQTHDAAKSMQRQILCYDKDAKEIYYAIDSYEEESEPVADASRTSVPANAILAGPTVVTVPTTSSARSAIPPPALQDAPILAIDILQSLVAQKLKKSLLEVPLDKTIKDLVGGESKIK